MVASRGVRVFLVAVAASVGLSLVLQAVSPATANASWSAGEGMGQESEEVRADLIDYGTGAFPLRAEGRLQSTLARAVLDGIPGYASLPDVGPEGPEEPIELIVELPAMTTFTSFAVPPMSRFGCCSGVHIATVEVQGSAVSPDEGFQSLVTFDIAAEEYSADQEFPATTQTPVRWLRISFAGRQVPDPDDYRGTAFTDLMGYGEQETREAVADEFTGIFLTGGGGSGPTGNRVQMVQDGALVQGCWQQGGTTREFSGGIENGILKVLSGDGIPSLYLINSEGTLLGVEVGRSYSRTIGTAGGDPTACFAVESETENGVVQAIDACEAAVIYGVNFDVDSDQLRPDSEPALRQILDALNERPDAAVTIEGHTDSDASNEYNLDLSERRAATVVQWLVAQGIDATRLTSRGAGEAEPIADNATAAGKAANRRVEVQPDC